MTHGTHPTNQGRDYFTAHEAHYGSENLGEALDLYLSLMKTHPETAEAGYCRSQIQNIVKALVPKHEILDAEVALARAHLPSEVPKMILAGSRRL